MIERPASSGALALKILRNEGPRALWNRVIDRVEERVRLRGLSPLSVCEGRLSVDFDPPPVLNVAPAPLSPNRGGSQIQLKVRLAEEAKLRTIALTYPRDRTWWLEIWTSSESGILSLGRTPKIADLVARAAGVVRAPIVHVENPSGLPLHLVGDLEERGVPTVLSLHDFGLFCRKPHLIEAATAKFCGYCQDLDRCHVCLEDCGLGAYASQADYRSTGGEALRSASATIYPSEFLRRQHGVLFPDRRGQPRESVVSPASPRSASRVVRAPHRFRVAFVGGAFSHKGGALIAPTMECVRARIPDAVGFVYGSGETSLFRRLRQTRGIRIRGYYRAGTLPSLLVDDEVSVAVLPSIWPEAYALVVDECLSVGVPVIAFDHGAVAERLESRNVGDLVPLEKGAQGLAESIFDCLSRNLSVPGEVIKKLPQPETSAREHVEIYRRLIAEAG